MPEQSEIPQSTTIVLDQKRIAAIQASGPKILQQAQELQIETAEDYDASAGLLTLIARKQDEIVQYFEKPAKEANSLHKFITGLRNMLVTPYGQAENLIKNRRNQWRSEQERIRQEKEQRERKIAKEQEEARALEEAKALQELGETEAANIVIERAVNAPPPPVIVPSEVPKQPGLSVRKVWKYRVVNPALHKREFLMLDDKKVNAIVGKLGPDAVSIIGGIEVFQEEVETIRRT